MLKSLALLSAALAFSPAVAFAQPAAPTPSDEVIKLSDFTVQGDRASGYRAQSAITATGFGARILDVPVLINVLTGEFVQDIGANLQSEALRLIPGVITSPNYESSIRIRGFEGLQSYRNGQYRRQLYSTWNMDRIEVIKGSSSIFFGLVRPGGVVNYVTKKPEFGKLGGDVRVTHGSWDFWKGELYYNVGGDTLAARVGVGAIDAGGWRDNDFKKEHYAGGSLSWQVFDEGLITVDLETVRRKNQDRESAAYPRSNSRYLFNPAVPAGQAPRAWLDANGFASAPTFDVFAPIFGPADPEGRKITMGKNTYSLYKSYTADLEYLQKIGKNLVYQLQLNYAIDDFEVLRSIGGDQEPFANGTVRFRFGNFANWRDSYNVDNKFTYRFSLGETNHTLSFGQELQRVVQDTPGWFDSAERFQDGRYSAFAVWNPRTDPLRDAQAERAASGQSWNIIRQRVEVLQGYYVGLQSEFLKGNLRTIVGARDNIYYRNASYERPVTNPEVNTPKTKTITPLYGLLYKFTSEISGFATYSKSLEPQAGADADGRALDAITGKGYDLGIKTEIFDGRLSGSVSYYSVERAGLAARDTAKELATSRLPFYFYGNTEKSEGIEIDLSYNPLSNWQILIGHSHATKAAVTASTNPARIGLTLVAFPKDVFTLWTKYDVRNGPLTGFSFGGGIRDSSDAAFASDHNVVVRMKAYTTFDFMTQYRFKLGDRDAQIQFNAKNVTDERYRESGYGAWGDPRNYSVSLNTKF